MSLCFDKITTKIKQYKRQIMQQRENRFNLFKLAKEDFDYIFHAVPLITPRKS